MQSFSSTLPSDAGLSALCKALAPAQVQITYCASNALPFRIEWTSLRGPVMFYGLTPDEAAEDARLALAKRSVQPPAAAIPVTDPVGTGEWAEAMRDLISDIEERRAQKRPALRVLRGGSR